MKRADTNMHLIWLRNDLRVHDNTALSAAAASGPTVAVYLLSPQQWLEHDDAPCKVDFWLRNLSELSRALGELNIPLLIRQASHWDDAPTVLLDLCQQLKVDALHVNEDYGVNESRRDAAVAETLNAKGIQFHRYLDQLLFKPGSVLTKSGTYFQVFSQFRKVCYDRLRVSLPGLVATPAPQLPLTVSSDLIPATIEGFETPSDGLRQYWPAGEAQARRRLDAFADARIDDYKNERDFPAKPGTSQLSAYLAAGIISPANACTPPCKPIKANSKAARSVPSPGSTSCYGASSTNMFWWVTHGSRAIAPFDRKPKPSPGATPHKNCWPGKKPAPVCRSSMRPCANCWRPAGCTTGCAWSWRCS